MMYNPAMQRTTRGGFFKICGFFGTVLPLAKYSGTLVPSLRSAAPDRNRYITELNDPKS